MKKIALKYSLVIVSAIMFISVIGLSTVISNANKSDNPQTSLSNLSVMVNDSNFVLDKNNGGAKFEVGMLNTEYPTTLQFSDNTGIQIKVNNQDIGTSKSYDVKLTKLNSSNPITISVKFSGQDKYTDYFINTIPDSFPKYSVKGKSQSPGDYYMTTMGKLKQHYIFKLNNTGEVVFYKKTSDTPFDFKKVIVGNLVRYCYLEGDGSTNYKLQNTGYAPTKSIVMDEHYNIIDKVTLLKYGDIPENHPTENHEFKILGDRHYIVDAYSSYVAKDIPKQLNPLPNGTKVINYVFQEIKDGKVIFQWESAKHPELYALSVEGNDYQNKSSGWSDWAHFNALAIDPRDNNFVCSYRSLDTLIKIDRKTGKIIWILGGKGDQFGLTENQKFSRQHNITIDKDGTFTLFDNGNAKKQTRILRFNIDEKKMKITSFKAFQVNGRFSGYMGSAQLIDFYSNTFVICWGGGYDGKVLPTVSEFDFQDNKSLFEFYFQDGSSMYRAYKY